MKCIKTVKKDKHTNPNEVVRTSDVKARKAVDSGFYAYCPKSEWKNAGRHYS